MGGSKRGSICPAEDNSIFVIRKNGRGRAPSNSSSQQISIRSYQSKTSRLTLDEDLEALKAANIVFIRQIQQDAERLANVPNKYIIVNSNAEVMFYAMETTDADTRTAFGKDQPFKIAVVNTQGEEVFDVDGNPGVKGTGAFVSVKRENVILGNVTQINKIYKYLKTPPSYSVAAADGKTLQKIQRQGSWKSKLLHCLSTNDFNVSSPDGTICKAKISRQQNVISLEEYSEADTYALSFHTADMDGKIKAILIAAVLMLDFQFYEKNTTDRKSLFIRALICTIAILLLIGAITLVTISAIDFRNEKPERFPGKIPQ